MPTANSSISFIWKNIMSGTPDLVSQLNCKNSIHSTFQAPTNPAKDTRDFMGPEIFKHTTSRGLCGFGPSPWDTEAAQPDIPFPDCHLKNNHACKDQYLADGNMQFKDLK